MLNKLFLVYPSLLFTSFSFLPGHVLVCLKPMTFQVAGYVSGCMYVCIEALELFTKLKLQNQPRLLGRAVAAGREKDYRKVMWQRWAKQGKSSQPQPYRQPSGRHFQVNQCFSPCVSAALNQFP